jgi:hypothetical protein
MSIVGLMISAFIGEPFPETAVDWVWITLLFGLDLPEPPTLSPLILPRLSFVMVRILGSPWSRMVSVQYTYLMLQ